MPGFFTPHGHVMQSESPGYTRKENPPLVGNNYQTKEEIMSANQGYELKKIKMFKGHGGEPCAQGDLYKDGKKVAEWSDDSWGGQLRVRFNSAADEAAFELAAKVILSTTLDFDDKPYDVTKPHGDGFICDAINHMSNEAIEKAEMLRLTKKGMVFDVMENGRKVTYTTPDPYTAENVAKLRKENPGVVIVNETLGLPLIDGAAFEKAKEEKRYRTLCRTLTLFILPAEAGGAPRVMQLKKPYNPVVALQLRTKYPALVEIINERYLGK